MVLRFNTDYPNCPSGDLSIERGQLLQIEEVSPDGWWTAKDEKGKSGIVPSTFLRVVDPKDERIFAQSDYARMWGWDGGGASR